MENRRLKTLGGGSGLSAYLSRLIAVVLLGAFLIGCSRTDERPEGILSDREMVRVLMEIYINEEKVNRLSLRQDSALAVFSEFESRAYQKLGVKDSVFQKSLDYYFNRPQELHLIYTAVVDSLQLREQRIMSKKE